jgi:hypothetical protein
VELNGEMIINPISFFNMTIGNATDGRFDQEADQFPNAHIELSKKKPVKKNLYSSHNSTKITNFISFEITAHG